MKPETKTEETSVETAEAQPSSAPAPCSAACPDFWIRYELKDGEERLTTSRNMTYEQVMQVGAAIDRVRATITTGDKWHCPNCDQTPNDPSSATAATRRADCNSDAMPPFAGAH